MNKNPNDPVRESQRSARLIVVLFVCVPSACLLYLLIVEAFLWITR